LKINSDTTHTHTHTQTHTYIYNYITPWGGVLKKSLSYSTNTPPFMVLEVSVFLWTLCWARWIQSTLSHPVSLTFILMLSSHLRLRPPHYLFPLSFSTKSLLHIPHLHKRAPCFVHFFLLDFVIFIILGEAYTLWSSNSCVLLRPLLQALKKKIYSERALEGGDNIVVTWAEQTGFEVLEC